MKKTAAEINIIQDYWSGKNVPQQWYSNKEPFSLQWYNDLAKKRYKTYYSYLSEDAEFQYHSGEKVLEVGVGIGTDLVQYAQNGAKVYGIDLGEDQVEFTKLNFKLKGLNFEEIKQGSAESIPYENSVFDLVYSFGVLHHTPNTEGSIEEVYRVLNNDGQAIIMLYARGWKHYFKRCFIHGIVLGKWFRNKLSWQAVYNQVSEVNGDSPKTGVYTKRQIKKLFKNFPEVMIEKRRLGEFIEYPPYRSRVLPEFIKNILHLFKAQSFLGENWLITAYKSSPPKKKNIFSVLFKHY
jgi:SAM-dependent methyltransferase